MIVEPNNDDHRGCSYTICVMKTGRLIMWNSKHVCSTSIMLEEYLHKQIKELSGVLEAIFTWAVPKEMHYPTNSTQ